MEMTGELVGLRVLENRSGTFGEFCMPSWGISITTFLFFFKDFLFIY